MDAFVCVRDHGPTGPVVLACRGEIDLATNELLRMCSDTVSRRNAEWVVADLTEVTFMDCASLRLLDDLRGSLSSTARWAVVCPSGPLHRLLTLTGFTDDHLVVKSWKDLDVHRVDLSAAS